MSKYFSVEELIKSKTAMRMKINNVPTKEVKQNLEFLAMSLLDPIREFLNRPIKVNSAYRSKELNKIVGGTVNSVHTMGLAADLVVITEKEQDRLLEFLSLGDISFDQAIKYPARGFVHVALNPVGRNRKMIFSSPQKGKYILL